MRHVLRLLGTRFGAALALVVAIALVVGVGRLAGGAGRSTVGSAPAVNSATATAPSSVDDDDGLDSPPPPPSPSTSPGADDPQTVALNFTHAWLHHDGVTAQQWFAGLSGYATDGLRSELNGADPGSVQASSVEGDTSVIARSQSFVQVVVPLDAGTLTLGLTATDGRWLVDTVDWARP